MHTGETSAFLPRLPTGTVPWLAIEAITYRDFQLVQGVVVWIALMYMVINLIVDISYNYLDPRLRKVR